MKKPFVVLSLLIVAFGLARGALTPAESDEFNGKPAPAFSLPAIQGGSVSLKDFAGHPMLLNFFASWCPPCRAEIGDLIKLHKQYKERGLIIVGFATDSKLGSSTEEEAKDVPALVGRLKVEYPVALASDQIVQEYKFKGIPTTVVIDANGKIVHTFYGYHNGQKIEEWVQRILPKSTP